MTRKNLARLTLLAVTCSALALVAFMCKGGTEYPPSAGVILSQPAVGLTTNLYPADVFADSDAPATPEERSNDVVLSDGRVARYILNKNGSTRDLLLQPDGEHKISFVDYYARAPDSVVRHEAGELAYAADGETVTSEDWYRLSGTLKVEGRLETDGSYLLGTYFADGVTPETELLTAKANEVGEHVILKDERWHAPESGHAVAYLDVLKPDGWRDLTKYDASSNLLLERHKRDDDFVGATLRMYFPGTHIVHLKSTTDARKAHVEIYRTDGTLYAKQEKTEYEVVGTFYDASGIHPLYQSTWWKMDLIAPGGKETIFWIVFQVTELAPDGSTSRDLVWQKDNVAKEERFRYTVDGVTFDKATFSYRLDDGTLEKVELQKAGLQTLVIAHAASENIRAVVPSQELVAPEVHDEIPVPPPERSDH
jgi:hypothetical protein